MSDVAKLQTMQANAKAGTALKNVLTEVVALIPKVSEWKQVPTSGSAVCFYDKATGKTKSYQINYQSGNMGNLVHELIHAAVNEAYGQDFVNYPNKKALDDKLKRKFDTEGRCLNEFDRQTAFMSQEMNEKISSTLNSLSAWAGASKELTEQQRQDIVSKLNYGLQWPHKEYDTVITQVLVWLHEWKYPKTDLKPDAKKPVVNALFEEVEKAVAKAYALRQKG